MIARAGQHGKSPNDPQVPIKIFDAGIEQIEKAVVLGLYGTIRPDKLSAASREAGAATAPATLEASHEWAIGKVVHRLDRVPGRLITQPHGLGRSCDGMSAADVKQILDHAEAEANLTRAAIRLPPGSRTRMVISVADLDGTIIGLRRMTDATIFSIDVAASKARNMAYFNGSARLATDLNQVPMGTAVTNRTISFGAEPLFPAGIDGSNPGPFFNLYTMDFANPCTQGFQSGAPNDKKSGIVFFPGSAGLYKNGVLVGGLGVSGDGVEQDDYVTSGAAQGFEAPVETRADRVFIDGVRMPYLKFPRNPTK